MNAGKAILFFCCMLMLSPDLRAQDDEGQWEVKGYIKDMVSVQFPSGADTVILDNLVHQRLNVRWFPTDKFSARLEIRTRLFTGDRVNSLPNYAQLVDVNNDYFDLSFLPVNKPGVVWHTMIDRAYAQWQEDGWTLSAGRQRVNWGVNLAWNPNDIFNAYSFFDFDYSERPG
ncbi:MAG: hypothetical protein OEY56_03320, partial [Cyclobacteriaceae bacterium]|nr:hypothetical protein [Cyclobacteriaceae bacterium]